MIYKISKYLLLSLILVLMSACQDEDCITCTNKNDTRTEICEGSSSTFTDLEGNPVTWSEFKELMIENLNCE